MNLLFSTKSLFATLAIAGLVVTVGCSPRQKDYSKLGGDPSFDATVFKSSLDDNDSISLLGTQISDSNTEVGATAEGQACYIGSAVTVYPRDRGTLFIKTRNVGPDKVLEAGVIVIRKTVAINAPIPNDETRTLSANDFEALCGSEITTKVYHGGIHSYEKTINTETEAGANLSFDLEFANSPEGRAAFLSTIRKVWSQTELFAEVGGGRTFYPNTKEALGVEDGFSVAPPKDDQELLELLIGHAELSSEYEDRDNMAVLRHESQSINR